MCLIAFRWQPDSPVPLIIAANRDEFYERPTAPLAWWAGARLLAGQDLRAGGAWMGVTPGGRVAAITNFRDPTQSKPDRASRGQIPVRFLEGADSGAAFLKGLQSESTRYNPFNLLLFDGANLLGYESHWDRTLLCTPGTHAVSNGDFDEPWPKVERVKAGLASRWDDDEALLALLRDAQPCEDARLPQTGVPIEWERALSPAFVRTPTYGTRASTILRLGQGKAAILEQRFSREGPEGRSAFQFQRP